MKSLTWLRSLPHLAPIVVVALAGCSSSSPTASPTTGNAAFAGVTPSATGFTLLFANGGSVTIDTRDWACVSSLPSCSQMPVWPMAPGASGMPMGPGMHQPGTMPWSCTPVSGNPAHREMHCTADASSLHFVSGADGFEMRARGPAGELVVNGHHSGDSASGQWSFTSTGCNCSASGSFTGTR